MSQHRQIQHRKSAKPPVLPHEEIRRIELYISAFKSFMEHMKWIVIAICAYMSIDSLAGKVTLADVNFKAIWGEEAAGIPLWIILLIIVSSIIVALLGIIFGKHQAKLRKDTVERLTREITELQGRLDVNRTSSQLTPRGDTHERDRS